LSPAPIEAKPSRRSTARPVVETPEAGDPLTHRGRVIPRFLLGGFGRAAGRRSPADAGGLGGSLDRHPARQGQDERVIDVFPTMVSHSRPGQGKALGCSGTYVVLADQVGVHARGEGVPSEFTTRRHSLLTR
jgi:hypothetical protein